MHNIIEFLTFLYLEPPYVSLIPPGILKSVRNSPRNFVLVSKFTEDSYNSLKTNFKVPLNAQ